jgi:hypothetical protein
MRDTILTLISIAALLYILGMSILLVATHITSA